MLRGRGRLDNACARLEGASGRRGRRGRGIKTGADSAATAALPALYDSSAMYD